MDTTERGDMWWKEAQKIGWRQGYCTDNSNINIYFNIQLFEHQDWTLRVLLYFIIFYFPKFLE
jgi:hypothetical protein